MSISQLAAVAKASTPSAAQHDATISCVPAGTRISRRPLPTLAMRYPASDRIRSRPSADRG